MNSLVRKSIFNEVNVGALTWMRRGYADRSNFPPSFSWLLPRWFKILQTLLKLSKVFQFNVLFHQHANN